ncbi:MAG: hypothetical protein AB7E96_07780 [Deferribacterales bacterium]
MFLIRLLIVICSTAFLVSCGGGGGGGSEKSADVSFKIDMSTILSDARSSADDMTTLEIGSMTLSYGSQGQMSSMDVTEAVRNDSPITISGLYINHTYTFSITAKSGSVIICSGSTDVVLMPHTEVNLACTTNGAAYIQFTDLNEIVGGVELSDGRTLALSTTGQLRTFNKFLSYTEDDDINVPNSDVFDAMVKSGDDDIYTFGQITNNGNVQMNKYDSQMNLTLSRSYNYNYAVASDAVMMSSGNIAVRLHGGDYGVLELNPGGDVVGFQSVEHMAGEPDQKLLHSDVTSKFIILDGTSFMVVDDSLSGAQARYMVSDSSNDITIHDGIIRESDGALLMVGKAGTVGYLAVIPAPYNSGSLYKINETMGVTLTACKMAYSAEKTKYLITCQVSTNDSQYIYLDSSLALQSYEQYFFGLANLPGRVFAGFGGRFIETGTVPFERYLKRIGTDGTMGAYTEDYPPNANPEVSISAPEAAIVSQVF